LGPLAAGTIVASAVRLGVSKETPVRAKRGIHPPRFPYFDYTRYTFSMGVEKRGFLWLSGQTAGEYDPVRRQTICKGDLIEQTRVVYEKMRLTPEAGGANFGDVVKAAHIAMDMVAVTGTTKKISIHPAWSRPDPDGLWVGVQKGPLLFISGQFGVDPRAATSVGRGDLPKQTRQAYGNVQSIVEAAGARMDDVVKTVEFLVPSGLHDYRRTAEIRRETFQEPYPAATGVVVQGLPQPDWLIAVDAVAVVSEVKPVADGQ
jgi:enamine deaminase RidA (YjgF/YER057c/UK114 family)